MGQGLVGYLDSPQHTGNFLNFFRFFEPVEGGMGRILVTGLLHLQVLIARLG